MTALNKDWTSKPTARSNKARLVSIFAAECKEHVFQIVSRIADFPNSVAKDKKRVDNKDFDPETVSLVNIFLWL